QPKRTEAVSPAVAPSPGTKPKDQPSAEVSARAELDFLGRGEESVTEEAVPKPTPSEPTATEGHKFSWKEKKIAIAGAGLVLFAISFGIVMFERNRSNTEAGSTSPVSESTP